MALKQTVWKPDTCGCEVVLEWDDTQDNANRTHSLKQFNKRCAAHDKVNELDDFNAMHDENKRKNLAFGEVKKIIPSLTPEFYEWSFDDERVLTIKLNGPSDADKGEIHSLMQKFGAGKVKVS